MVEKRRLILLIILGLILSLAVLFIPGDSFDIGSTSLTKHPDIITILQNPTQLAGILDINEEQANNIRALIVGGGAGLSSKYLSKTFGSAVAGAFGGLIAGLLAEKIFKPRK